MSRQPTAREVAMLTIADQAEQFPNSPILAPETDVLSDARDKRLATAIHRTTLQHWLTLECLLNGCLRRPVRKLEPYVRATLLCGAAQLLFLEKLPQHAVINESVRMVKNRLRPGAGNLVNAVLRRLAQMIVVRMPSGGWTPLPDRIPVGAGSIHLDNTYLPPEMPALLAAATSHPELLVQRWIGIYGVDKTRELLLHNLVNAPTVVFDADPAGPAPGKDFVVPHETPNFWVWNGEYGAMVDAFRQAPQTRWAQDVTSSLVVTATKKFSPKPKLIIDYCAGRGVKTKQLALAHPQAKIIATDADPGRMKDLRAAFGNSDRIAVHPIDKLEQFHGQCDLLLLDVPCSNTGVLARRLEARYRYSDLTIGQLCGIQRQIVRNAMPLLAPTPDATLVYSTCSLEPQENQQQVDRIQHDHEGFSVVASHQALPGGEETTYHDGGFYAMLRHPRK